MPKIEDYEQEFVELTQQIATLTKRQKEIVAEVKKLHTGEETTNYGAIQVVVVKPFWTFAFDEETFKSENRELYNKYLKPKHSDTTLKVQVKKGK